MRGIWHLEHFHVESVTLEDVFQLNQKLYAAQVPIQRVKKQMAEERKYSTYHFLFIPWDKYKHKTLSVFFFFVLVFSCSCHWWMSISQVQLKLEDRGSNELFAACPIDQVRWKQFCWRTLENDTSWKMQSGTEMLLTICAECLLNVFCIAVPWACGGGRHWQFKVITAWTFLFSFFIFFCTRCQYNYLGTLWSR